MADILEDLKENQILHHQNVMDIKLSISKKYPDYSPKHAAVLFASAVHKIIDKNIIFFDTDTRQHIKNNLLKEVVKKEVFEITALDIFETCSALELKDEHYYESLTNWLNHNQPTVLSKHQVLELTDHFKEYPFINTAAPTLEEIPKQSKFQSFLVYLTSFQGAPKYWLLIFEAAVLVLSLFVILNSVLYFTSTHHPASIKREVFFDSTYELENQIVQYNSVHKKLHYKQINRAALSDWLTKKNSLLAEEPYFSSIMTAAKEYDINPLLMFAIAGQEQSFVPKSNPYAIRIANNPFNVYGSWKTFNTNIKDSSRIAARTIVHLSEDCPPNEDPIQWLNAKYAEDPHWHLGVSEIFNVLETAAAY